MSSSLKSWTRFLTAILYTLSLPRQLPKSPSPALLVLFLPSGTVLGADQYHHSFPVHRCAHNHHTTTTALYSCLSFHSQKGEGTNAWEDGHSPQMFLTLLFPSLQVSLLLCSPPGLPNPIWLLGKKNSLPVHQRERPKAFDLIYLTLSLQCDASILHFYCSTMGYAGLAARGVLLISHRTWKQVL